MYFQFFLFFNEVCLLVDCHKTRTTFNRIEKEEPAASNIVNDVNIKFKYVWNFIAPLILIILYTTRH